MPSIITRGGMSAKALGFGASSSQAVYVEDVFSTYVYTGTGSALTITNGIDLAGKGGLIWNKSRSQSGYWHELTDTARGLGYTIFTNNTNGEINYPTSVTSFNSDGYSYGTYVGGNTSGASLVSWTFRKQKKFFDVVTYTGNGAAINNVAHNLGCKPGFIIIKRTDGTGGWAVNAAGSDGTTTYAGEPNAATPSGLNYNAALNAYSGSQSYVFNSTFFRVGADDWTNNPVNINGANYVAYLFAQSNSGGFGAAGTDSVVACGSFTTNSSAITSLLSATLGWEPQFLLVKRSDGTGSWYLIDVMRGDPVTVAENATNPTLLAANTSNSESGTISTIAGCPFISPNATGFNGFMREVPSANYIYLAIRRGPMKTPTDATKIYTPASGGNNASAGQLAYSAGFPVDFFFLLGTYAESRLLTGQYISVASTGAEASGAGEGFASNTGIVAIGAGNYTTYPALMMARAPGFFDQVCYSGTGSAMTIPHNLGVIPQLIIYKSRNGSPTNWPVLYNFGSSTYSGAGQINSTSGGFSDSYGSTSYLTAKPTSSNIYFGNFANTSNNPTTSGQDYEVFLFATCPGVSKVGSYTGTGSAQNIDCGFSAAARFILIKRTDSTGGWYQYDSARGISSGNDPYYLWNDGSQTTGTNYVDTYSTGFSLTASAPAELNANGGSYIFLAIA